MNAFDACWRTTIGLCLLAGLAACGGDGSVPPATIAPADGSAQVDIRPAIRVAFGAPVDAGTATAGHVTLSQAGFVLPATVTYDDAQHAMTIVPTFALKHDARYTVAVSGVVDAQGRPVPDAAATFTTWINAEVEDDIVIPGASVGGSLPLARVTTALDPDGHPSGRVSFDEVGAVLGCRSFTYQGGFLAADSSISAGSDGKCFTADDHGYVTSQYERDANGRLTSVVQPGLSMETFGYDARGNVTIDQTSLIGADGLPGTADDQSIERDVSTYDDLGRLIRTDRSTGVPGEPLYAIFVFVPGSAGAPDRTTNYMSPGLDGLWGTADDVPLYFQDDTRDARGNVVMTREYGIQADGTPYLQDTITSTYDSHDNLVTRVKTVGDLDGPVQETWAYDTSH